MSRESNFTDRIAIDIDPLTGINYLKEDLIYHVGTKNSGIVIVVPEGFPTDFASIPWWCQGIVQKYGKHTHPAIIHDFFYSTHSAPRATADAIFREALAVAGVSQGHRWLLSAAVFVFGRFLYPRGPRLLRARSEAFYQTHFDSEGTYHDH